MHRRRVDDKPAILHLPVDRSAGHAHKLRRGRGGICRDKHDRARGRRHREGRLLRMERLFGSRQLRLVWRLLEQGAIGEIGEPLPVILDEVVRAGANVVADRSADRRIDRRILGRAETGAAEELPGRLRGDQRQKFAARIGPAILDGARRIERPRRDQREEAMLVARQFGFAVGVGRKGWAEPVWKSLRDIAHRLAVVAAREGGTGAARFVRDDQRKPLVTGAGPERRLAVS